MKESVREAFARRQPALVKKVVRGSRTWARSVADTPRMRPSFLILGGQRCGTTSLYRYLSDHPQVHPALVKEIQYFTLNYGKGPDWYRSNFPPIREKGISFDASPYYLFHPAAPKRAAALVPDARLIVLLRNPVDRAFSHYQHNVGLGVEDLGFEAALDAEEHRLAGEEERLANDPGYFSPAHRRYSYAARGRYELQLARWLEYYGPAALKVVVSEEFFADPGGTLDGMLEFLGLTNFRLERYEAYSRRGRWDGPPLSEQTRGRLQEHFREHIGSLEARLGRSMPWK
ncbi:hypothetical protein BH23ACT12_BH23ACT12_18360 [soil metagenome]